MESRAASIGESGLAGSVESLCARIARWTEHEELHTTAVPGLSLFRRDEPTEPISDVYEPSICQSR